MEEQFVRTAYLLGDEAIERLKRSSVILFGVGGVGSFCAEALARAGIGKLCLVDPDTVSESNLNRQLVALRSTIGRNKAEVMKERIADINPWAEVTAMSLFYLPENADSVDLSAYDVVIDAVDTVSAKIEIAVRANALGVPVVSAMGAGNKLHPEMFEISDLAKTSVCPLTLSPIYTKLRIYCGSSCFGMPHFIIFRRRKEKLPMEQKDRRFAVLIDADNVSPKYIRYILGSCLIIPCYF